MDPRQSLYESWKQHVTNWRQSGKGIMKWCTEINLSYKKFLYWRKKIEGFLLVPPKKFERVSFSELSDSSCTTGIDILVNGTTIRLHKNFDETTLKSCIRLLGE